MKSSQTFLFLQHHLHHPQKIPVHVNVMMVHVFLPARSAISFLIVLKRIRVTMLMKKDVMDATLDTQANVMCMYFDDECIIELLHYRTFVGHSDMYLALITLGHIKVFSRGLSDPARLLA